MQLLKSGTGALGLAVYDAHGNLMAASGPPDVMAALARGVVEKSLQRGIEVGAFGHAGQWQWLEEAFPIHDGNELEGAMAIVADAELHPDRGRRSLAAELLADCGVCYSDRRRHAGAWCAGFCCGP